MNISPELNLIWEEAFGTSYHNKYGEMTSFLESLDGQPMTEANLNLIKEKRQEYLDWMKLAGLDYLLTDIVKTPYEWYSSLRLMDLIQRLDYMIYQMEQRTLEGSYLNDRDKRIKQIMEKEFDENNKNISK